MFLTPQTSIHLNVEMRIRKEEEVKKSKSSPPDALATGLTRLDKAGDTSVTCLVHFATTPPPPANARVWLLLEMKRPFVPPQRPFDLSKGAQT